ncbi:MAG: rod shape-determining protein MreC [Actinomycetes bacterium]
MLLVLTSLTLVTLDFRGFGPIDSARQAALSVFAPVGDAGSSLFRPIGNFWHGAFEFDDLKRQNDELQAKNDELSGRVTSGDVAKETNQQLLAILGLPPVGDQPTATARVVSGSVANFDDTIEIDKGENAGIHKGMPVRSGNGLVGTVVRVSGDRSVVKLITDNSFQVAFAVVGRPDRGIARGQGSDHQLTGTLETTADVRPGQILVTTEVPGGLFPPDISIGTIASVSTDNGVLQKRVTIDLLADLHNLTYVSVVLWTGAP